MIPTFIIGIILMNIGIIGIIYILLNEANFWHLLWLIPLLILGLAEIAFALRPIIM